MPGRNGSLVSCFMKLKRILNQYHMTISNTAKTFNCQGRHISVEIGEHTAAPLVRLRYLIVKRKRAVQAEEEKDDGRLGDERRLLNRCLIVNRRWETPFRLLAPFSLITAAKLRLRI